MKKAGGNIPPAFFVQSFDTDCRAGVSLSAQTRQMCTATVPRALRHRGGMNDDEMLANLAWVLIRDLRRRRDVDPAIRRAWVRLYVGVIRRACGR
jgi:hypothetical protein